VDDVETDSDSNILRCSPLLWTRRPRSTEPVVNKETEKAKRMAKRGQTLPTTDMELEKAGTSFLDAIEKSLGLR
jgi:hypothetical protein